MASIIEGFKRDVKHWWIFMLIGILLLLAGFYAFSNPLASYLGLAVFFGFLILFNGIMELSFALSNRRRLYHWGWTFAAGLFDSILGIILLVYPAISINVFPFILGFYLLLLGASLGSYAFQLHALSIKGWAWILLGGMLTIIFALSMIFNPLIGVVTIVGWTAFGFIIGGVFNILFSLKLKKINDHLT